MAEVLKVYLRDISNKTNFKRLGEIRAVFDNIYYHFVTKKSIYLPISFEKYQDTLLRML